MGRKNYEAEMFSFAIFTSLTKEEQEDRYGYTTQKEFAKHHHLDHEKILSEWKRSPKFQKMQKDAFMDSFQKILPYAKKSLEMRGIEDGDVSALKEIFKITGLSIERVENVSNQDIQTLVTTLVKILNEELHDKPQLLNSILERLEDELGE